MKRRAHREITRSIAPIENDKGPRTSPKKRQGPQDGQRSLARLSERLFTSFDGFSISMLVWAGFFLLCLATFIVGNHDLLYPAGPDLDKQVGFFWSLSWPIECLLLYPASFLLIANLVSFWRRESQAVLSSEVGQGAWNSLIHSMRLPFWVAAIVAFVFIFGVQWGGVYLTGLKQADGPDLVDWILVTRVRPDVVTSSEALSVSLLAFFYSGMIYWFYFIGLLLLFAVTEDFDRRQHHQGSALMTTFSNGQVRSSRFAFSIPL